MRKKQTRARTVCAAISLVALACLGLAAGAAAKLTGEFTRFAQCPYTNAEVRRCLYSTTEGGTVVLGNKTVTITSPAVLQGGYGPVGEDEFATKFFAAKNGITLSKAPQSVPGGLLGIVPPEKSPPLVKALSAFFFENALTGVNSTLELAKPASAIRISENHLAEEFDIALEMPVQIHLENPFLGKNCLVGSSSAPIPLKLTTGTTAPPLPNKPIKGKAGELELLEEGTILKLKGTELMDNSWAAPSASGCGGILSFLVNPIINAQVGLPSAAGKNTAILKNTLYESPAIAVKTNDETHP
ncbi:MAG TPA: hypothetical protein VGC87_07095 [Pyrinomonadaceae bacterium]|jgi:hypothetical protein